MLEIAVASEKKFSISDVESNLGIPSYTYLTLRELKKMMGGEMFYFIIGSDAFIELESWKNWREIIINNNFIIAVRPGSSFNELNVFLANQGFETFSKTKWIQRNSSFSVQVLLSDFTDISSTDIRIKIGKKQEWEQYLPRGVVEYIQLNKLYDS